jgi:hypothetical protein
VKVSARNDKQTNTLAYGGVISWLAIIGGIFLVRSEQLWALAALAPIAAVLLIEGRGLITNWRGSAGEAAAMIRGRPPCQGEPDRCTPRKTAFVRNTLGPTSMVMGGIFLWGALRRATAVGRHPRTLAQAAQVTLHQSPVSTSKTAAWTVRL